MGAYFSKPDWHHDDFWENAGIGRFTSRGITYNVAAQPERWTRFKTFFRDQVIELVRDYGPLDILWLDGVWLKG
ncbi:MAG: alpha-L-fucosidase, partial [Kiritimatiellae bacterium]|nr:alpha-L-fucosidase [Kiritimatiellia bacterium]